MKVECQDETRFLLLRARPGDVFPESLLEALSNEESQTGYFVASGVVADAELRGYRPDLRGFGEVYTVAGPSHVASLCGSIGLSEGTLTLGTPHAVLSKVSDTGLVTHAGSLTRARVVALEVAFWAFRTAVLSTGFDEAAGLWLAGKGGRAPAPGPRRVEQAPVQPEAPATEVTEERKARGAWAMAVEASDEVLEEATRPTAPRGPMPPKPPRKATDPGDLVFPERGDVVDHFAFGRCDVIKSDGDRLYLKLARDGRIKEIALEMLKVIPLAGEGQTRRFRLERKL